MGDTCIPMADRCIAETITILESYYPLIKINLKTKQNKIPLANKLLFLYLKQEHATLTLLSVSPVDDLCCVAVYAILHFSGIFNFNENFYHLVPPLLPTNLCFACHWKGFICTFLSLSLMIF